MRETARGLRRWAAALAGLLGCALLTMALTSAAPPRPSDPARPPAAPRVAPAGPADAPVRVLQMNLCDSGLAPCYTGRAVRTAAALIRAEAPDLVTVNEVCQNDVPVLAAALAAADRVAITTSAFRSAMDRRTGGPVRCANGRPYGIGLVARRSRVAHEYVPTSGVFPVQDPRDPEERAWLCQDAVTFTACTTHLDSSSAAVARAQCDYLLDTAIPAVLARGGPASTVLGGDLNLRPGGAHDVRSCVPPGDRRIDDGGVQNVVVTADLAITAHRAIDMRATTDHPGLLVTLTPVAPPPPAPPAARTGRARCPGPVCLLTAWRFSG